jgi:hypothetical protein
MTTTTTPLDLDAIKANDYRPDRNGAAAYRQSDLAATDVPALVAEVERLRALEQNARTLHAERVIREHDHEASRETGRTWSICTGCSNPDIIDALDDGELIEEYEGVPWPCATYSALNGEQTSAEVTV